MPTRSGITLRSFVEGTPTPVPSGETEIILVEGIHRREDIYTINTNTIVIGEPEVADSNEDDFDPPFESPPHSFTFLDSRVWSSWVSPTKISNGGADSCGPMITVNAPYTLTLRDVHLYNARGTAIKVNSGATLILDHCWIRRSMGPAIDCDGTLTISRSIIEQNNISKTGAQIIANGPSCTIEKSLIDAFYTPGYLVSGTGTINRSILRGKYLNTGTWTVTRSTGIVRQNIVAVVGTDFSSGDNALFDDDSNTAIYPAAGSRSVVNSNGRFPMPTNASQTGLNGNGAWEVGIIVPSAYTSWSDYAQRWKYQGGENRAMLATPALGNRSIDWLHPPVFPGDFGEF